MGEEILFISDLHLDRKQSEITQNFMHFIKTRAVNARVLYILGDLFEIWLGDDDPADEFRELFAAIKNLSASCDIFFLAGNRDFLVGSDLAERLGFKIIHDEHTIQLGEQRTALMHGDALCTDDVEYLKFKAMVRDPQWQQQFLAKPLAERRAISEGLRQQSKDATSQKDMEITDVNAQAVDDCFERLEIDLLIHGHTHRPAIHRLPAQRQRIVLGDWHPQPSYLSWQDGQFTLADARVQS
jgi:UDP-2,3-diacylglucosamine hydrolase